MKICKDKDGYFVLDSCNQKVQLWYNGGIYDRLPTLYHIGNSYWHKSFKGEFEPEGYEILIDDIRSFKAVRFAINDYFIKQIIKDEHET